MKRQTPDRYMEVMGLLIELNQKRAYLQRRTDELHRLRHRQMRRAADWYPDTVDKSRTRQQLSRAFWDFHRTAERVLRLEMQLPALKEEIEALELKLRDAYLPDEILKDSL